MTGSTHSPIARAAFALALVLAAAATFPAAVHAEEAPDPGDRGRSRGFLGRFLEDRPRAPKPWHRYGDFYASAGIAPTFYREHTEANDDGSLSAIDARDTGFGWHLNAGFAGRHVGVELGWMDLGSSKFDATSDGSADSWAAGDVSAEVEASGWTLSGLARIPVKPRWVMLARLGLLGWTSKETFVEQIGSSTVVSEQEDTGTSLLMGLGFEYDIHNLDHFWIRTELTRAQVDADELPVLGVNGSLVRRF